jgi:hypothetical protein
MSPSLFFVVEPKSISSTERGCTRSQHGISGRCSIWVEARRSYHCKHWGFCGMKNVCN